jgi:hypothetical protein
MYCSSILSLPTCPSRLLRLFTVSVFPVFPLVPAGSCAHSTFQCPQSSRLSQPVISPYHRFSVPSLPTFASRSLRPFTVSVFPLVSVGHCALLPFQCFQSSHFSQPVIAAIHRFSVPSLPSCFSRSLRPFTVSVFPVFPLLPAGHCGHSPIQCSQSSHLSQSVIAPFYRFSVPSHLSQSLALIAVTLLPFFPLVPTSHCAHSTIQCSQSGFACGCCSVVCILSRFSHHTCLILMSSLVSNTRVPPFIVYRPSNQPDVAGMM